MQNGRRTYGDTCGIARALDLLGERWTLLVVRELILGPKRFGQLQRGLSGASPNVITQRLRELEAAGIVHRHRLAPPADVTVYELTQRGIALEPILVELGRWGSSTRRQSGREMSVDAVLLALKTMYEPRPGAPVTYGLELDDEPFTVTAGETLDISRGRPVDAAARLSTDRTTLRMVVFLGTGVRAAEEAGALSISGSRRVANRFPGYFRAPAPTSS